MDDPDPQSTASEPDDELASVGPVRRLARRGRGKLRRVLRSSLDDLVDRVRDECVALLSSPDDIRAIQRTLAGLADWTFRQGFRSDPNAELLFEFVDWLDGRHSRRTITRILLQSPIYRDPAFLEALAHLSQVLSPWSPPPESASHWSLSRIEQFKRRTGTRLLNLLVELAYLECDDPPPEGSVDAKIDYFEAAPIPQRFRRLAAMSQGRLLMTRRETSRSRRWIESVIGRLGPASRQRSELAPFLPGAGDDALRFLVFSTTFFLQSYLLRNLIEALPDIAADVRDELDDRDIIELH